MRQISKGILRKSRAEVMKTIVRRLERSTWGQGGHIIHRTDGRVVAAWPGARPAQIKAGARKLYDVIAAQVRRQQADAAKKGGAK